ncbi:hypothetical protein [Streptomyces sp. NPDC054887]
MTSADVRKREPAAGPEPVAGAAGQVPEPVAVGVAAGQVPEPAAGRAQVAGREPEPMAVAAAPETPAGDEPGEHPPSAADPAYPSPDAPAPVPVPIDDPATREGDGGMPPDTLPPSLG